MERRKKITLPAMPAVAWAGMQVVFRQAPQQGRNPPPRGTGAGQAQSRAR